MFNWLAKKIAGFIDIKTVANALADSMDKERFSKDVGGMVYHNLICDGEFRKRILDGLDWNALTETAADKVYKNIEANDVAKHIDYSKLSEEIDTRDFIDNIAEHIAENADLSSLIAEHIDKEDIASMVKDEIDMDDLAEKVVEDISVSEAEVASNIDLEELAGFLDSEELAGLVQVDNEAVAEHIDYKKLANALLDAIAERERKKAV